MREMEIGEIFRRARKGRKLSRGRLAQRAVVSEKTVQRLEDGLRINRTNFKAIARELGIEMDEDAIDRATSRVEPEEPIKIDKLVPDDVTPDQVAGMMDFMQIAKPVVKAGATKPEFEALIARARQSGWESMAQWLEIHADRRHGLDPTTALEGVAKEVAAAVTRVKAEGGVILPVRFSQDEYDRLTQAAASVGMTVNAFAAKMLEEGVADHRASKAGKITPAETKPTPRKHASYPMKKAASKQLGKKS